MKNFRIAFTGGGSGGHIYPLIAVAEELERISIDEKLPMEMRYFGPVDSYKTVLEETGVKVSRIISGKVRRYSSLSNVADVPKFFIGFLQALFKLFWFMPDAVFSKGGTGAFPVVLAARFYGISVIIHESDAQPGLNNLFSARFSKRIAVSFEKALDYFDPKKAALTGSPIRRSLLSDKPESGKAKEDLGFDPGQPLALFLGGSQGAQKINDSVIAILKDLMRETQILHQTGAANFSEVEKLSKSAVVELSLKEMENRYRPVPYLDSEDLKYALSAADIIVARAGSNTIFEAAAFSKPVILIPLAESANDHQRLNAYEFAKSGGAVIIEEANLVPGILIAKIKELLGNRDLLGKMGAASGSFFKPDAAEAIAREILRLSA